MIFDIFAHAFWRLKKRSPTTTNNATFIAGHNASPSIAHHATAFVAQCDMQLHTQCHTQCYKILPAMPHTMLCTPIPTNLHTMLYPLPQTQCDTNSATHNVIGNMHNATVNTVRHPTRVPTRLHTSLPTRLTTQNHSHCYMHMNESIIFLGQWLSSCWISTTHVCNAAWRPGAQRHGQCRFWRSRGQAATGQRIEGTVTHLA